MSSRRRGSPRRSVVDYRRATTMAWPPDLPKLDAIASGMPAGTSAVTPAVAADQRVDQGFPSLRLDHWWISWARQYGGSLRGPMPFFLDDTTNGRDWHINVRVRRRLSRWQIWTRRCRRSAIRYWSMFLGSSRRAPRAPLKMPHANVIPWTRGRATAKGSHSVTVLPRRHRRLHLPRRHRRQQITTTTAWGARWGPTS